VVSLDTDVPFCRQGQRLLFFQHLFRVVRKGRPPFAGRGRTAVDPGPHPEKKDRVFGEYRPGEALSRPFFIHEEGIP